MYKFHFRLWCVLLFLIVTNISSSESVKPVVFPNSKFLYTPNMTCADIKFIVDFHNDGKRSLANGTLRGQPKAADMQKLAWDPKLAKTATDWAKKMILGHNPNRDEARFMVGENLFMTASTNTNNLNVEWSRALNAWFLEHKLYRYKPTVNDPVTAHYTQMIWSDITYVGCGSSFFLSNRSLHKYYVCNYGPSGNYLGHFPYMEDDGSFAAEVEFLISIGIITDASQFPNCDNLCCDYNQCNNVYGPNCTAAV